MAGDKLNNGARIVTLETGMEEMKASQKAMKEQLDKMTEMLSQALKNTADKVKWSSGNEEQWKNVKGMGDIEKTKPSWVGMHKILVQAATNCIRSDFYIVDLIEKTIRKLPGILWNHGLMGTTVVLDSIAYAIGNMLDEDNDCKDLIPKAVDINPEV